MFAPTSSTLELTVCGRDFTFTQSPGSLQSSRSSGTTGAAVWRVSVKFAEWLLWPRNPLTVSGVLRPEAVVMELGSGISGLVPLVLAESVGRVVATDQPHVLKGLRGNVAANVTPHPSSGKGRAGAAAAQRNAKAERIVVLPLDWEEDDAASLLASNGFAEGVDVLLACDCVYNYALIEPLVQTCVDVCRVRQRSGADGRDGRPTVVVVAQQLRQAEVFEQWLSTFATTFRVWRVLDEALTVDLKGGTGFVVHVGVLR